MPRSDIFLGWIRQIGKFNNDYVKLVHRMDFVKLCQISTQVRLVHTLDYVKSGTNYVNLDLLTKSNQHTGWNMSNQVGLC